MSTLALPRHSSREAAPYNKVAFAALMIARRIQRRAGIWKDQRRLQALPDYLLSDIGISRSEIASATEFGRINRLGPSYRI